MPFFSFLLFSFLCSLAQTALADYLVRRTREPCQRALCCVGYGGQQSSSPGGREREQSPHTHTHTHRAQTHPARPTTHTSAPVKARCHPVCVCGQMVAGVNSLQRFNQCRLWKSTRQFQSGTDWPLPGSFCCLACLTSCQTLRLSRMSASLKSVNIY